MGLVREEVQDGRDDSDERLRGTATGKYKEGKEQTDRQTDIQTKGRKERIQTWEADHTCLIVSVARSERRKVGGIKQLT